jgi:PAS domain S-box-containing protein
MKRKPARRRGERKPISAARGRAGRHVDSHADFLAAALDAARMGICFVDDGGRFTEANPAFCEMTGFTREELIGQSWTLAAPRHVAAQGDRFLRAVLSDSSSVPGQWKIHRKNGEQLDAQVSFRSLERNGRRCAVVTFTDLTARIDQHTEVIRRHRNVLLELAALDKRDRRRALERILAADGGTLGVERASYWAIVGGGSAIEAQANHLLSRGAPDPALVGQRLSASDYPVYFSAVLANRPVVANLAQSDPHTREFTEGYLKPSGITSMLDVPVWFQGKVVGVICHEHVGSPRVWTAEEIDFASSVASMVSLTLEAARQRELVDALSLSEEKYRRVVENASEAIIVAQDGYIRYANPQTTKLSGFAPEELLATPFLDFVHPEDRARVRDNYVRRLRGEPADTSYEFRIHDKRGLLRWININAVVLDWEGRPATLNFLTDITAMRELQEVLERSLAERDVILKTALTGITFSVNRRHHWVNDTFARMLGYEKHELVGQSSQIHLPDRETWEAFGAAAYPVLATGKPYIAEWRFKRKDGSLFWCQVAGSALDPGNLDRGSIWTHIDVTERHDLQETLQRSLAERDVILKSALVGISFAINRRHEWVNDTFARMLGYEAEELMGKESVVHFPDRKSWEAFGSEAYPMLAAGRPFMTERQMKRKDGSLFWCQIAGNAVDPKDLSKGSIWTNVDITERKRAEEEMRRALEKEKELSELKSRFVAMTSHEFRTPLATILSSAELLEHYGTRLAPEEKQELYQSIRTGVDRMTRMLDNVLVIGKSEAQMLEFKPALSDLAAFCDGLVDEMRLAAGVNHSLAYTYEGTRGPVQLDERLLRHVLVNLISNALKYSPQGGAVHFSVRVDNGTAAFEVRDSGIGIPLEDQARLFETFHRARNVGNISGTGLGLAIVKKSLDLHGGSISFNSIPGRGTRFEVTIPLAS